MTQRLLFSGASGFLGTIIKPILTSTYELTTIGLTPQDDYQIDIAKEVPVLNKQYDVILHAAGKAHSDPKTETEKKTFFDVNLQGTKNLCAGLEKFGTPKSFIFISTVAVYGIDFGEEITEEHPLNGNTPYALSKIQAEYFLQEWCAMHDVTLGIIRPSLIAGKNPPGNLGAMIKGIQSGKYFRIGKGKTKKSVLMAEDIAMIIPKLAKVGGIYNITDDYHPSFAELETLITGQLHKKAPISIPYWCAKSIALFGDKLGAKFPLNSIKLDKIVNPLTFSNKKAKNELDWQPMDVLSNFKIR